MTCPHKVGGGGGKEKKMKRKNKRGEHKKDVEKCVRTSRKEERKKAGTHFPVGM